MKDVPSIIEFVTDPQLLGLSVSPAQTTCLKALHAEPLTPEEHDIWVQCTGRTQYLSIPPAEVTILAGARAGKDSRIATPEALYETVFGGHETRLHRGERGVIPLVAQDQRATRIAFGYLSNYLTGSPLLSSLIEEVRANEIALTNRMTSVCFPCTASSLRGWTNPVGLMDEVAFWRLAGAVDSDVEIQASIRRGMVQFANPKLIKISTPYMKSGILYDDFQKYWAKDCADVLIWKASSLLMNPSLHAERLERERRLDPSRFSREFEAEFGEDLESYLPSAWIDACMHSDRYELPPKADVRYLATCDTSGGGTGATRDAFTFAIVHSEGDEDTRRLVQDVMKGWKGTRTQPLDLAGVVREQAELLRRYGLCEVFGDKYAAGWVRQAYEREHMLYRESPFEKSAAYVEAEPWFAQGRIELLNHPTMIRELKVLERRPLPGGKTRVDHPNGSHDDHANSLALGVAILGAQERRPAFGLIDTGYDPMSPNEVERRTNEELEWKRSQGILVIQDALAKQGYYFPND